MSQSFLRQFLAVDLHYIGLTKSLKFHFSQHKTEKNRQDVGLGEAILRINTPNKMDSDPRQ